MATQSIFHKKNNNIKQIKINDGSLPKNTNIWCWWCCHPFETIPVSIPISYDNTKDCFGLIGIFCNFSCCKSYILSSDFNNKSIAISNIKILSKRMGLNYKERIIPAPPRQTLDVFGGYLTIDEFRNTGKIAINHLEKNHYIQEQKFEHKSLCQIDGNMQTYKGVEEKKELFSLKRAKPLKKNKGTLEAAMGLTVK